jgi:hypothetical protein
VPVIRTRLAFLALAVLALPSLARAQDLGDRFNIRLSLSGLYVGEQQDLQDAKNQAATFSLAYGDLRAVIDGRRLPGNFEIHVDGRVRVTGDFSTDAATQEANQITSRGYFMGREYDLREAYFRRRGSTVDFAIGRQYVLESDALRIDGARVWWHIHKHWDGSVFAGSYPNPYSRSLTTDYQGSNGYYGFAFAGGADVSYIYDKLWGSISATGIYLGGKNDGGPFNPAMPIVTAGTEAPRAYLTWTGFYRLFSWLDLYHDLVLDVAGSAGVQLTRLDAMVTARAGKYLTLRAGYDHMSSIAIEMYLTNLLASRADFMLSPSITNNLIVERTARDQVYLHPDVHFGKVDLYAEGRLRFRTLVNAGEDPQFIVSAVAPINTNQVAASFAWDATIGARDLGTLWGIRAGLWYTLLDDFRSSSHVLGIELGRSFYDDRLGIDLSFLYARTRDQSAGNTMGCVAPMTPANSSSLILPCFGTRDGAEYEPGLTLTGTISAHWFAFLDYRMVVNETKGVPDILTHSLIGRIEARY